MNKRKFLVSLVIFSIVFTSFSVLYAFTSKIDLANLGSSNSKNSNDVYICVSETNTDIDNNQKQELISASAQYIPTLIGNNAIQTLADSEETSSEITVFHDNTINQDYYDIRENNYTISLNENSTLRAFSDDTFDYNLPTTTDKNIAENFIVNFYNNLNISHDYELAYLEVFDDSMWEADFVKKVDNIYNYYDSIKIFFSPEQQKIAALRIHSSSYPSSNISTLSTNISDLEAKDIVKDNFANINDSNIKNKEIVFTKPNNFFTRQAGDDIISENNVVKAWKITLEKDSTTTFVFVDYSTGNIIGGEQVK